MSEPQSATPYAQAADLYWQAGWHGILPLPAQAKKNPPAGYTGATGRYPSYPDVATWIDDRASGNIALRMPPNVIGLDVDDYGDKKGGETLVLAEAKYGPLPATWRTTSRDDGVSGIRLYRVPEGLAWPGELGPGTEIIQRGHRYALVWPSLHPEGRTYRWIGPGGVVSTSIPDPDELPHLPEEWVAGVTGGLQAEAVSRNSVKYDEAMAWFANQLHAVEDPCSRMQKVIEQARAELAAGSAHNPARDSALRIARLTDGQHSGGVAAMIAVREAFIAEATRPERALAIKGQQPPVVRTKSEAAYEWSELVASAVGLVTANSDGLATCDCYGQITGPIVSAATASTPTDGPPVVATPADAGDAQSILRAKLKDGEEFILNIPDKIPTVWGDGDDVLWAEGEALMIAGPPGVGKTTLTSQIVRGLLGLQPTVLGMSFAEADKILYLAMDRPSQIRRAMARAFHRDEADVLRERIDFWQGPPPGDFAKHPDVFLALAQLAGATHIIVDSLKDAAIGLSEDEVGAAYNRARQKVLAEGIQVLELHHMVKRGANGAKPTELADVYGSGWITAGAGSVVLLWGAAGDPIVDFRHLKQPVGEVGPYRLQHDHDTGQTVIFHGTDILSIVAAASSVGVTAKSIACQMFETDKPLPADIEKARRKLEKLVNQGHIQRHETSDPYTSATTATVYKYAESDPSRTPHAPNSGQTLTPTHADDITAGQDPHANPHAPHAPDPSRATPPLQGGGLHAGSEGPPADNLENTPCRKCGVLYLAQVIVNGLCPGCAP